MGHIFDRIEKEMAVYQIPVSEDQKDKLFQYYELLIEKNKIMNLTAITDPEDVMIRHFLDSLMIVKAVDLREITSMADVGTGAGFPAIPVKIIFPHLQILMIDSLGKRVRFREEVIEKLRLTKITALHVRAEDAGRDACVREQYDLCVSRAVSNLSTLAEYCLPLVRKGGWFVSYKSGNAEEEIRKAEHAVRLLGGEIQETKYFDLPQTDIHRSLVCIRKTKKCPSAYPRKAGIPGKEPLS